MFKVKSFDRKLNIGTVDSSKRNILSFENEINLLVTVTHHLLYINNINATFSKLRTLLNNIIKTKILNLVTYSH